VCATCSEHFTRRYSATRHNLTIHYNRGEIVPLLEYIVGRNSGRYHASDPFWYRRSNKKRIHKFAKQLDMVRLTYVCATCSEIFTRKYSATRHNHTIHNNRGEIVSLLEYLAGRNSGRYRLSYPSLYRRGRREERNTHAITVAADYMGDTYRQQDPSPSIALPSLPSPATQDVSPSQPTTTTNNQGILSQDTMLKIQELRSLLRSYPHFCPDVDAFIRSIIYFCNNGDRSFLDEKLEELRMINNIVR
jgi:hypothetical protein